MIGTITRAYLSHQNVSLCLSLKLLGVCRRWGHDLLKWEKELMPFIADDKMITEYNGVMKHYLIYPYAMYILYT